MGTSSVKCPDCKKEKNSKLVIYDNPIAIKENNGDNIEDMSFIKAKNRTHKTCFSNDYLDGYHLISSSINGNIG